MGSATQHRSKADRTREFADAIAVLDFPEWEACALFYCGLHRVESLFAHEGVHTTSHEERNRRLRTTYPEMLREFKHLHNFSLLCRYRFATVNRETEIPQLRERLTKLEEYIDLEIEAMRLESGGAVKPESI